MPMAGSSAWTRQSQTFIGTARTLLPTRNTRMAERMISADLSLSLSLSTHRLHFLAPCRAASMACSLLPTSTLAPQSIAGCFTLMRCVVSGLYPLSLANSLCVCSANGGATSLLLRTTRRTLFGRTFTLAHR